MQRVPRALTQCSEGIEPGGGGADVLSALVAADDVLHRRVLAQKSKKGDTAEILTLLDGSTDIVSVPRAAGL